MKRKITLEIDCGSTTCAPLRGDGQFCAHCRTTKFGQVFHCQLFSDVDDNGKFTPLEEENGCLLRHEKCLRADKSQ